MPNRHSTNTSLSSILVTAWLGAAVFGGCDRYPHSKLDVTHLSSNAEYISVKIWKTADDLNCTSPSACQEDESMMTFKFGKVPPPEHYRIGLHFSDTGKTYRAALVTFAPGTGTQAGKYCIQDMSDAIVLGPFRPSEYFGEVSTILHPASGTPSTACIDKSSLDSQVDDLKPLISSADNTSELKIFDISSSNQASPPASRMSINGWSLRPDSQVTISYSMVIDGQTVSGSYSTNDADTSPNKLTVLSRAPMSIVLKLTPDQNAALRGLSCTGMGECKPSGAMQRTKVTIRVSGAGGETTFETTP